MSLLAACSKAAEERQPAAVAPKARPAASAEANPAPVVAGEARVDPTALAFYPREEGLTCHGAPKPFEPNFADEADAIRATGGAKRTRAVLQVGASTFENKSFDTYEADGAEFVYRGRFANSTVHVVEGSFYEWRTWTLVDTATGATFEMSAPPAPSPDGQTFAGVSDDPEGMSFNGVQVVELRGGKVHEQDFDVGFPCDLRWVGPNELELKATAPNLFSEQLQPTSWKTYRVVREGGEWRLIEPTA